MATALLVAAAAPWLLVVLLAVPVTFAFDVRRDTDWRGEVAVHWLFGLVRVRQQLGRARRRRTPRDRRTRGARRVRALLGDRRFRQRLWRLVRDLVAALDVRYLDVHVAIGLGDPADTGRLWAIAGPLAGLARSWHGQRILIVPDFGDAAFAGHARGRVGVVPLRWLVLVAAFVLSPAAWHAWRAEAAS